MSSFEVYPGVRLAGQPVPDDLSTLMHQCSGSELCSFCAWRKDNPIELGWERLLEDSEPLNGGSTVCGVNLTCSQVENPDRELSTQQTADFCGYEHRRLRHSPAQIQLFEPGERAYLVYREDVSKTNQGGLASRKRKPKEVYQYANLENPSRCFVRIYKLYNSKCPTDRPKNAFYLTPLGRPKESVWYSRTPLGHNVLGKIVTDMMKQAGYDGHYTNHSLRVSLATRLFDAQVDEQLIMSRTGHSSTDGVRAYKRASSHLKKVTSDVLNNAKPSVPEKEPDPDPVKRPCVVGVENKENSIQRPTIQITGGTNITININSSS